METIYLNIQMDCEATQTSIGDPALGERAIRGLGQMLEAEQMKATFAVLPSDMAAHAPLYRELEAQGHEIALHAHPAEQGREEFLGVCGLEDQVAILQEGKAVLAQHLGHDTEGFTPGYFSANDYTFPALEAVGLRHGTISCPTRDLPQCACVWGNSPQDVHYGHRHNRCLAGSVDVVDVPVTIDPDSRMWGGAHPQDLRVELVDAKNHFYTIEKAVKRQLLSGDDTPVKYLKMLTHNIFDYSDERDFRRETLIGMLDAARRICDRSEAQLVPATTARIAAAYREAVPLPARGAELTLDSRGR
ncbi:polysaccharide deacetylase family protein [Candidatus Latescibacterota bacterium]